MNKLEINKNQHLTMAQILQVYAQYSDILHFKAANKNLPARWETAEGDVLWLQKNSCEQNSQKIRNVVCFATPEELMKNSEAFNGAVALSQKMETYRVLKKRHMRRLDKEHSFWAPSILNSSQQKDLRFGCELECFLKGVKKQWRRPPETFWEYWVRKFKLQCIGLKNKKLTLSISKCCFMTSEIQEFKTVFNRMIKRRIKLLNHMLIMRCMPTIGYIPLGLESDCTPSHVGHKLFAILKFEKQSFKELIRQDVHAFADRVAVTPDHVETLMRPLLETMCLWYTLWPDRKYEITKEILLQMQILRFHSKLSTQLSLVEHILHQVETIIREHEKK